MKLSRCPSPLRVPPKPVRAPSASRSTVNTGWTSSRMSRARSLSSPTTESTRNGMSSLTTSSTETPGAMSAATRRSFGAPGMRCAKNAQASPAITASPGARSAQGHREAPAKKLFEKILRNIGLAQRQHRGRRPEKRLGSAAALTAEIIYNRHITSRRPRMILSILPARRAHPLQRHL